jgi:hypothetical protein
MKQLTIISRQCCDQNYVSLEPSVIDHPLREDYTRRKKLPVGMGTYIVECLINYKVYGFAIQLKK